MSTRRKIAFWCYAAAMLILTLMRAVGSACLSLAVVQFVLSLIPFRQGAAWASWTIAVAGLVMCAGSLYAMTLVMLNTPATLPGSARCWAPCSCSLVSCPHSNGAIPKLPTRAGDSRVPSPSAASRPAAP